MKKEIDRNIIYECLINENWDFGNSILYNLCKKNPLHEQADKIIAKTWLIGRSYSAALERFKGKRNLEGDKFYSEGVAKIFKNSKIDSELNKLKENKKITKDNLLESLKVHYYLITVLNNITNDNKRSFCSKYLHFHLPELFFIYDNRARTSINKYIKISNKLNEIANSSEVG